MAGATLALCAAAGFFYVAASPLAVGAEGPCCQKYGGGCYDGVDACNAGDEAVTNASCPDTTNNCVLASSPKKSAAAASSTSSGTGSGGSSSGSGGSGAVVNPTLHTGSAFGAPTNPGNSEGGSGKSLFVPKCADTEGQVNGGCRDVGAFVAIFVNYVNATFAILGAVALLFFVYGGIVLLTSGGSPERVKKGRDVLVGAVIGIMITFGASLLIKFVIGGVTGQTGTLQVQIGNNADNSK